MFTQQLKGLGVCEFRVSFFSDGPWHYRHGQLCACSASELENALLQAWRHKWYSFVIVSHGFEMIKNRKHTAKRHSPDRIVIQRFEKLCRFLDDNRDKFETSFFSEIDPTSISTLGSFDIIRSRWHRTAWRWVEQIARRRG